MFEGVIYSLQTWIVSEQKGLCNFFFGTLADTNTQNPHHSVGVLARATARTVWTCANWLIMPCVVRVSHRMKTQGTLGMFFQAQTPGNFDWNKPARQVQDFARTWDGLQKSPETHSGGHYDNTGNTRDSGTDGCGMGERSTSHNQTRINTTRVQDHDSMLQTRCWQSVSHHHPVRENVAGEWCTSGGAQWNEPRKGGRGNVESELAGVRHWHPEHDDITVVEFPNLATHWHEWDWPFGLQMNMLQAFLCK